MAQALLTQQPGLVTSPNAFGSSPPCGLAVADNCIIRDAGVLESRRGNALHSALVGGSRLTSFEGAFVALAGTSLEHYSGGSWSAYSGTYSPPDAATLIRFLLAAKCLLFTTSVGVQKLDSLTGTPRVTGVPRCLAPTLAVVTGTGDTWFPTGTQVAYRFVLGRVDAQNNLLLGPPSAPIVLANASGSTKAVNILFDFIPAWMQDTSYFIRAYRSPVTVDTSTQPLDEMALAVQYQISAADLALAQIGFNDTTLQSFLGTALYTNATQEGIAEENDAPPLARDFCNFKGTTIYANTTDRNRVEARLLRLNQPTGMKLGDTVLIKSVNGTDTYTAGSAEDASTKTFQYFSASVESTMRSFCRIVNQQASPAVKVRADYLATGTSDAGTVLIEDLGLGQVGWTVTFSALVQPLVSSGTSLSRTGSTVTVNMNTTHGFVVGDQVDLENTATPDPNFPVGIKLVLSVPGSTSWTYLEAGSAVTSTNHTYTATRVTTREWFPTSNTPLVSDDSREAAGLTYSKINQPEAAPLENSDTAGDGSHALLRVLPLRDSVLLLKEDGIYRLTGDDPSNFVITPYDLTTLLVWPESAVAMDDVALFMSQRGPVGMSESAGVFPLAPSGMDCPVKETLLALLATAPTAALTAFGVAYANERQYLLWCPAQNSDVLATQAFVFQTGQTAWTRWPVSAADGIIDPVTGKLALVDGLVLLLERKDYASTDYQDVGGAASISAVTDSTHVTMAGPGVGDLVTQGSNSARVLSVAAGNALTLDTAGSWTTGAATYARAILCVPTYLPFAGAEGNVGATHHFQELVFNFRSWGGSWLNATFATDVDPATEQLLCYGAPQKPGNVNVRAGISRNKGRGVMGAFGFVHQQALANFQLQSTSLLYDVTSTRTPSHGKGG